MQTAFFVADFAHAPRSLSCDTAQVESVLSDKQAADLCKRSADSFVQKLVTAFHARRITPKQLVWLHKKAMDIYRAESGMPPVVPAPNGGQNLDNVKPLLDLFRTARKQGLTRRVIRLRVNNQPLSISAAPESGKNAGCLYVKSGMTYYGKVAPNGVFHPSRDCNGDILRVLQRLAKDPVAVAKEFAQQTGRCCFCGLTLTDDRSTSVGYGPVCADNYGLPWG